MKVKNTSISGTQIQLCPSVTRFKHNVIFVKELWVFLVSNWRKAREGSFSTLLLLPALPEQGITVVLWLYRASPLTHLFQSIETRHRRQQPNKGHVRQTGEAQAVVESRADRSFHPDNPPHRATPSPASVHMSLHSILAHGDVSPQKSHFPAPWTGLALAAQASTQVGLWYPALVQLSSLWSHSPAELLPMPESSTSPEPTSTTQKNCQ